MKHNWSTGQHGPLIKERNKMDLRPSFPTNKKNHTLPVRLITSGTAYAGLRSKSRAVKIAFRIFRFSQLFAGLVTEARGVGEKLTAARRMKGVVSPQAMPTRRKPSMERKIEGVETSIGRRTVTNLFCQSTLFWASHVHITSRMNKRWPL